MYRSLDPQAIVATLEALERRIDERFPDSGIGQVARELLQVGRESSDRVERIQRPHVPLRIVICVLVLAISAVIFIMVPAIIARLFQAGWSLDTSLAITEPALNELIFLGAMIIFFVSLERRWRRNHALRAIHELRSLAHVVDMHQLTKDPQHALHPEQSVDTPSSPKRVLTPFQLSRYLDYCAEMFSLIGKLSALYVQDFDDPAVIASVNDVDQLTTGLSRKVWQKIVILHSLQEGTTPLVSRSVATPATPSDASGEETS